VTIFGPTGSRALDALLDTGAMDTVFEEKLAARLGIDLTNAPVGTSSGIGGISYPVRYARVQLRIADNLEQREWPAWVGFTAAKLRQPLLGYAGFLQFFDATFRGAAEEVELAINPTYPGA
jgi:predicted aspartyl protease